MDDASIRRMLLNLYHSPLDTYEQVGNREGFMTTEISNGLAEARRNVNHFGYAVPHISRGSPNPSLPPGRLFAIPRRESRSDPFSPTRITHEHLIAGELSTAQHIETMCRNCSSATRIYVDWMTDPVRIRLYERFASQLDVTATQAETLRIYVEAAR